MQDLSVERMVMKEDMEMLLMHLDGESPQLYSENLAETLSRIAYDYDLDLDDYISNKLLDYVHLYQIEQSYF